MASKQRKKSATRSVGEKPHVGRRFVEDGRVRIEWQEDGKRRRRSFGEDSKEARRKADAALEEILANMRIPEDEPRTQDDGTSEKTKELFTAEAFVRSMALSLMDTADKIAQRIRPGH